MHKLKAKERKDSNQAKVEIICIAKVESSNIPNPHLLPLVNSFNFNLSFLILLDIISDNIPIPFL